MSQIMVMMSLKDYKTLLTFIEKIEEVGNDPQFSGIFQLAHQHGFLYQGPTWTHELEAVNQFLMNPDHVILVPLGSEGESK